ncbi:unnamed protein product [Rhizophagus irregularis]|nr:unnamed protein product [Rhizophagus irregularis]
MEPVTAARSEVMNYYDYYYYYFRHLAHTLPKYSYFYLEKKKNNEKKKIVWNAEFVCISLLYFSLSCTCV